MSLFTKAALAARANRGSAYFFGGDSGSTNQSDGTKYSFHDDTRSAAPNGLSSARTSPIGFGNPTVAGYIAGGFTTGAVTTTDKFAIPAESRSTLGTGLTGARWHAQSMQDDGVAGYVCGGSGGAGTLATSSEKLTVPGDTWSTVGTNLVNGRSARGAGLSDAGTAGYIAGSGTTAIEKYAFPSDTRSTIAATLAVGVSDTSGVSDRGVAGFVCGGISATRRDAIYKLSFVDDTTSTLSAVLQEARDQTVGASNYKNGGYIAGGFNGTSASLLVDKLSFTSETRSNLTSLASARRWMGGFGSA